MEKLTPTTHLRKRARSQRRRGYAPTYYLKPQKLIPYEGHHTALDYWKQHVTTDPAFDPNYECFVVLWLDGQQNIIGHVFTEGVGPSGPQAHAYDMLNGCMQPPGLDAVVVMQHHAASEPEPTTEDFELLYELTEEAGYHFASVRDYILVGQSSYCCIDPDSKTLTFTKIA